MVLYLGDSVGISDLRIEYSAGVFNAITEMKVRYELILRLYLQAVSGVNQAIDLMYQLDFDPSKP